MTDKRSNAEICVGALFVHAENIEGRLNDVLLGLLDNPNFARTHRDIITSRCLIYRLRTRAERILKTIGDWPHVLDDVQHLHAFLEDLEGAEKEADELVCCVVTAHHDGLGTGRASDCEPGNSPWEFIVARSGEFPFKIGEARTALRLRLITASER